MSSVGAEQHKFQPSHQLLSLKKSLRDIDIPPRKLLTRRAAAATYDGAADMYSDETFFQKYLPHNNMNIIVDESDDDDSDPYSSDHFRMYEFKVRKCTRSRSHDWTDCPFAHPGEKARRRDPKRYRYSGSVCPEYRRGGGSCSRGDTCEFSHGVFECWLHPDRYRTEACKDGKNCKRKVCFFAHTPRQIRVLPVNSHTTSSNEIMNSCKNNNKNSKFLNPSNIKHSCLFCHCNSCVSTCSPTSTLFGMSRFFSPPMSPSSPASPANGVSPLSRYVGSEKSHHGVGVLSYKGMLNELRYSLEGLNYNEANNNSPVSSASNVQKNLNWLVDGSINCEDQQRFVLSPSSAPSSDFGNFNNGRYSTSKILKNEAKFIDDVNAPDLGWVNELLM
ncbi:hypothetical protein TanjilG_03031 [Lupinus angustifolius]|uniref:C3H1-type domain-containing protein n=1 Tax=Lupinus angustifolius TaxID=3871 RepID=A0A4P1RDF4_LUPAN|nr:PREDICTED: zinc finger CCCH domain-containing protein 61-like [Lupinus angustifolius]OIW08355.1 hypothetical protein TanjilG_03031 [Lupinus angustifolius]